MKRIFTWLLIILFANYCLAQITFEPPTEPAKIRALKVSQTINIDGKLDEASWFSAPSITEFIQKDPTQGAPASMSTEAKILYDGDYLYVGAVCKTTNGKSDLRTQNMQRDFSYFQNDLFGIAIDGFLDKRNAMVFQTNPYGTQREILVMDGEIFNREWSGLWSVRTQISDSTWTVEMAIPWSALEELAQPKRAPKDGEYWRVNYSRVDWHMDIKDGKYIKQNWRHLNQKHPE